MSQQLLDDFKATSGYRIIADLVLRLDKESTDEARSALKTIFYILIEFTSAGFNELRPTASTNLGVNMFRIEGFQVPEPLGKGKTVRNPQVFQLFLNIFNRSQSYELCLLILESIRTIYQNDDCNYFILESQNMVFYSLDDSGIKIHTRSNELQIKFLEILEFLVFNMKFVPCKELVSIGFSIQNYT